MAKKSAKNIHENLVESAIEALKEIKGLKFRTGDQYEAAETIPTSYRELNEAIGIIGPDETTNTGGIPIGHVVEFYGPEAGGKSNISLGVIANCQKAGYMACLVDAEHSFNPDRAEQIGIDLSKLIVVDQFSTGEEALSAMENMINTGLFKIVVLDSTAALITKDELEGEIGKAHMAPLARLMSQALRKIVVACAKHKTTAIFINQERQNIGVTYGPTETTPGGKALKFYSSLRIRISQIGYGGKNNLITDSKGNVIGGNSRAKVVKNRFAPPYKDCEFVIYYTDYVPSAMDKLFALGRETDWKDPSVGKGKIIKVTKDNYKFKDYVFLGDELFKKTFLDSEEMAMDLYNTILENAEKPDVVMSLKNDLENEIEEMALLKITNEELAKSE